MQVNCDLQVHIDRFQCSFSLVSLQRGIQRVVTGVSTSEGWESYTQAHTYTCKKTPDGLLLILTHKTQNHCFWYWHIKYKIVVSCCFLVQETLLMNKHVFNVFTCLHCHCMCVCVCDTTGAFCILYRYGFNLYMSNTQQILKTITAVNHTNNTHTRGRVEWEGCFGTGLQNPAWTALTDFFVGIAKQPQWACCCSAHLHCCTNWHRHCRFHRRQMARFSFSPLW